ncbi:hypothetical protein [Lonepinella sp. MS14435]|uniref:hypothetical protein n=1 Tax=Lonepinella sp. MS14435 TaxID=3003618 RepID=UPI0036DDFEB3
MFLQNLEQRPTKELFLELAVLLAMTEGGDGSDIQGTEIQVLLNSIDSAELQMLKQYESELAINYLDFILGLENITTELPTVAISNAVSHLGFLSAMAIPSSILSSRTPTDNLSRLLGDAIQVISSKYGNNEETKKELIQQIISDGGDIFKISPEVMKNRMISLPNIKYEIIDEALSGYFELKNNLIGKLTPLERKTIVFELCGIALSDGILGEYEFKVLRCICKAFQIDFDYLEEFKDVIQKINEVTLEAFNLISE